MRKKHLLLACNFLLYWLAWSTTSVLAQQPAFPGAQGAGMFTTGGRGTASSPTTVFEVTNLNDDGLPGSLRYALTTSAAFRTVVFRVSGTIHLNSKLSIRANTTIAGQTAPGDGICVADYPVSISGDNVIVRYMRFRLGDKNQKVVDANGNPVDGSGGDDAFGALGANKVIIDHCSISWSSDEAMTIYRGDNLTIQWCIVSEPLNYSYHWETGDTDYENHGYGGIWGAKRASLHHNLVAHCRNRTPRFSGVSTYTPSVNGIENVDFRNNVIYNWGINNVYGGEGGNYNVVNNYYKWGPNTGNGVKYRICNPSFNATNGYGKWYVDGNYVESSPTNTSNNWAGVAVQGGAADVPLAKANTPFDLGYPLANQSALDAYEAVLAGAGCFLPKRDTLDERIVNNVRNRTGRIIDVQGGYPHGTPYAQTVSAWPMLNSLTPLADADHDGMSNDWETSNGLNPNDGSDRNTIAVNGYTNLENYLNSLTTQVVNNDPVIYGNSTFNPFSQTIGSPSVAQTFQVSGTNLSGDIVISAPVNYQISINGTTWTNSLSLTPVSGNVSTTTISVRLNATANGTYSGTITSSAIGAATINMAVSGTTANPEPVFIKQKQIIGMYPAMEGGFENQAPGAVSSAAPTGAANPSTTTWTTSGNANITNDGSARTGNNHFTYTSTSTSTKNNFSPAVTSPLFTRGTKYIVQYYYRAPAPSTGNAVSGLLAATDNTSSANFTTGYSTIAWTGTNGSWQKAAVAYSLNNSYAPTTVFAGLRFNGGGTAIAKPFDVDDFVVYPADNQLAPTADVSAPDSVKTAAATGNTNFIDLGWSAPSTGIDGGGYMVLRSTSPTAPAINANGIYSLGNTIGSGNTVVYLGTNPGFTDDGKVLALSQGITYYYHIFTADKAFNYSPAVTVAGSITTTSPVISLSGNLNNFNQTIGTPSASQTFNVQGNNLNAVATITAPSGFELSEDESSWHQSLNIQPENKALNQTAFVRLNANTQGAFEGNITVNSTGAAETFLPVKGNASNPVPAGYDAVVASDGSGNYTSIQAAIDAAPSGRTIPYRILIRKGRYWGKVVIPSSKPFLQLVGEDAATTTIAFGDGIGGTSTVNVQANDCMLMNLTLENTQGAISDGPQSLAIKTDGDRIVLKNCRFISGQDTVFVNGSGKRVYFKDCYLDGNVDFVYGAAIAVFDSCIVYGRDRVDNGPGGVITAANTPNGQAYGLVFRDCILPNNNGFTKYTLGRPWQNSTGEVAQGKNAFNKTVFLNSKMSSSINPVGWSVWDAGTNTAAITYAEYKSRKFDGTLVDVSQRVSWSKQLTDEQAAPYYVNSNIFGSWDPYSVWTDLAESTKKPIALANFRGIRNASGTILPFNICWPVAGVKYELYRSADSLNFVKTKEFVSPVDTTIAFTFNEALPPSGISYYYKVIASKAGYNSYTTDTIIKINTSVPLNGDCRSAGSGGWTNNVTAISTVANGSVTSVTITASNTGYTTAPAVSFAAAPSGGTTATGTAILTNGVVTGVNITNPGSGYTSAPALNFSTSGGYNSVWEKYNSSTKSWEKLPLGTGASGNVTIRSGHTISLNALVSCNSLTIENGAVFQSDGQNRNMRLKGDINNSGVFGGTNTSSNKITVEFDGLSGVYSLNGEGLYNFSTLRPLTGVQNLTIDINADLALAGTLQAWYGSGSATNYGDNNVVININKGYTVKASVLHSSNTTNTAASFGNYTYNVNGVLDLSASTTLSGLIPHASATNKAITLNVNGLLKTGSQFRTVSSSPSASEGKVILKVGDSGLVDASKSVNTFVVAPNYFVLEGNGGLKRYVGTGAVVFPVATSSGSYNPVTLANAGSADNYTIRLKDAFDYQVVDSNRVVKKQWNISEDVSGGSDLTTTLGWTSTEHASGFSPSQPTAIMQYNSSNWTNNPGTITGSGTILSPYTISTSGISTLSALGITNYTKGQANVKFEDAAYVYDGNAHAASAIAYGSGGVNDVLTPAVILSYKDSIGNVSTQPPVKAGRYVVNASYPGNAYYNPVKDSVTLVIKPRALTIIAEDQSTECGGDLNLLADQFKVEGLVVADSVSSVVLKAGEATGKGTYPVSASAAQGSGLENYVINYVAGSLTVTDVTKPVPDLPVLPQVKGACSVSLIAPTATDACAGKLTATTTDPMAYNEQGTFTVNWKYDDGNGNIVYQSQTVIVKDESTPVITFSPGSVTACYSPAGTYVIPGITATDSCGTLQISYSISGATVRNGSGANASGTFNTGESIIHWIIKDGNGNETTTDTKVIINNAISVTIPDVYAVNSNIDTKNTLYLGYGPSSLTIKAVPAGGTAPYTYTWNNNLGSSYLSVTSAGLYTVKISDALGCESSATITIKELDVRCGNTDEKVKVCHNGKEICISRNAVQDHLDHGDRLGSCNPVLVSDNSNGDGGRARIDIPERLESADVVIYPNPVTSVVQIGVNKLQPGATLNLYNSTGISLGLMKLNNSIEKISIEGYNPGVYILVIKNGNKVTTRKVIKQ